MRLARLLWVLVVLGFGPLQQAFAATRVEVLDTHPRGDQVTLGPNQNFSLRLAYATDVPAGIWIQPYYRGKRVMAGTSPSPRYTGSGETIAWFFLMPQAEQVDEIRITAGDGGLESTPVVATYRVHVVRSSAAPAAEAPPPWVAELTAQARAAQPAAMEAHRKASPPSIKDVAVAHFLVVGMMVVGFAGLIAPVWQFFRWRGGWRLAAAIPAAVAAFVVLRIAVDVSRDPTSHNLWPFEVLITGAGCGVAALVLALVRWLLGARASAAAGGSGETG